MAQRNSSGRGGTATGPSGRPATRRRARRDLRVRDRPDAGGRDPRQLRRRGSPGSPHCASPTGADAGTHAAGRARSRRAATGRRSGAPTGAVGGPVPVEDPVPAEARRGLRAARPPRAGRTASRSPRERRDAREPTRTESRAHGREASAASRRRSRTQPSGAGRKRARRASARRRRPTGRPRSAAGQSASAAERASTRGRRPRRPPRSGTPRGDDQSRAPPTRACSRRRRRGAGGRRRPVGVGTPGRCPRPGGASSRSLRYAQLISSLAGPAGAARAEPGHHQPRRDPALGAGAQGEAGHDRRHRAGRSRGCADLQLPGLPRKQPAAARSPGTQWFHTFDERRLNLIYQEQLRDGRQSNFFRTESPIGKTVEVVCGNADRYGDVAMASLVPVRLLPPRL